MITIFSTPKPFRGHIGIIQRNALKSWTLLNPDVEVILFGDEHGSGEAAAELCIRHEPHVERNSSGSKRIDYIFGRAQELARHDLVCYVNCDIVLTTDFIRAVERVRMEYSRFLMVGRRWDTPITRPLDFSDARWAENVCALGLAANDQRDAWWIDYFVFPRATYGTDLPPLAIGTIRWDNWLVWKALDSRFPVVDASEVVFAVHQNHDYSYHPQGKQGVWEGEEAKRNLQLAGGRGHLRNISHSTRRLTVDGRIRSTWLRRIWSELQRFVTNLPSRLWYSALNASYAARQGTGLNREGLAQLRSRVKVRKTPE
jgi:hypothetical protein